MRSTKPSWKTNAEADRSIDDDFLQVREPCIGLLDALRMANDDDNFLLEALRIAKLEGTRADDARRMEKLEDSARVDALRMVIVLRQTLWYDLRIVKLEVEDALDPRRLIAKTELRALEERFLIVILEWESATCDPPIVRLVDRLTSPW